jgi:predicted ABC-type ATPase
MLKSCDRYQNYEFALIYSGLEIVKFCLKCKAYGYYIYVNVLMLPASVLILKFVMFKFMFR